jgi:hypothetical protein
MPSSLSITIEPSADIVALQTKVIAAMAPFRKSGGDQNAFVPDPTGTPFDPYLFSYVDTFVDKQAGDNFNPHVTTGTGPLKWVEAREKELSSRLSSVSKSSPSTSSAISVRLPSHLASESFLEGSIDS